MDEPTILSRRGRRPVDDGLLSAHLTHAVGDLPLAERLVTYLDRLANTGNRLREIDAAYRENWLQQVELARSRPRAEAVERGGSAEHDRYRDA